jgi:4-hydroxy-tetrahydrodipicolinate reductase
MAIRILVNGAKGLMGQEAVRAISADPDLLLVGEAGRDDDLTVMISQTKAAVVVDLTVASAAFINASKVIDSGIHLIMGTTGLLLEQIHELQIKCKQQRLGAMIVPNFSIGAVLLMKYAQDASRYLGQNVEIIEMHHAGKKDSPSGTAIKTAQMIASHRCSLPESRDNTETIAHARGADYQGIPIHSVRLPGLVAHEEVIFGAQGETLTLRHDCIHRQAFMPGLLLACKKVVTLSELVYGLEHVL